IAFARRCQDALDDRSHPADPVVAWRADPEPRRAHPPIAGDRAHRPAAPAHHRSQGRLLVKSSEAALDYRALVARAIDATSVRSVDDVSLVVRRGEIYGLLGANGSGKSTLIRVFSTLLEPDHGEVSIFGLDVARDELAVKRLINRVSVEASFFKKLSAMENLVYAGRLYGVSPEESRPKIVSILRRLGIEDARMTEPLEKLPRGMQQKVAIARAFL